MWHIYNFNKIFGVETNIDYFDGMLHDFKRNSQENGNSEFHIKFVKCEPAIDLKNKPNVNLMLYYNEATSALEFNYPWIRKIQARLSRDGNNWEFAFNGSYERLSSNITLGWEFIDVFRSLLISSLVRTNRYMVHGGAAVVNGSGVIMPSYGNTGKSTTIWMLAKSGHTYLTDEFALFDNGYSYGFPCSSLISKFTADKIELKLGAYRSLKLWTNDFLSYLFSSRFMSGGLKLSPDSLFPIGDRSKIEHIAFIEKGWDGMKQIDVDQGLKRLIAIQKYEWPWASNPFLLGLSYFDKDFNLEKMQEQERQLMMDLLQGVKDINIVASKSGDHYKTIEAICRN